MLPILVFNWLNGTLKVLFSERLMMKDDMLVTLLSTPATVPHASLMRRIHLLKHLSISDESRTVSVGFGMFIWQYYTGAEVLVPSVSLGTMPGLLQTRTTIIPDAPARCAVLCSGFL